MNQLIIFCSLLLSLFATKVYSNEKYLFLLGGGGEPAGNQTIFDEDVKIMSEFVKTSDWKSVALFDGGHKGTEDLVNSTFKNKSKEFSKKNMDELLNKLTQDIIKGKIKKNDQLLIAISNHGWPKELTEKSHSLSLTKDEKYSMDKFSSLVKLADKKGIKLAFIDSSCYSGATQYFKNISSSLCAISVTGPDKLSQGSVMWKKIFTKTAQSGKNLEELYLDGVRTEFASNFPMISTKEGEIATGKLQEIITPYFYSNLISAIDAINYGATDLGYNEPGLDLFIKSNNDCVSCFIEKQDKNFKVLIDQLNGLSKVVKDEVNLEKLIIQLREYNEYLKDYYRIRKGYFEAKEEIIKIIKKDFSEYENKIQPHDVLIDNFEVITENIKHQQLMSETDEDKKSWDEAEKWLSNLKTIQSQIKSKLSINSQKKLNALKAFYQDDKMKKSEEYAYEIRNNIRDIYANSYDESIDKLKKTNPCRDFKL